MGLVSRCGSVLVVVEPQRLLARVALALGIGLVAAHPGEGATVELDLDPAVDAAEIAGRPVPLLVGAGLGHGTGLAVGESVQQENQPALANVQKCVES